MTDTPTSEEILSEALRYLSQNTAITLLTPGGAARGLLQAMAVSVSTLYRTLDTALANTYPSTASGPFLDMVAEPVGVTRGTKIAARTSSSDRNVRFSVESGTLTQTSLARALVENKETIVASSEIVDDASLRLRVRNAIGAGDKADETAVLEAARLPRGTVTCGAGGGSADRNEPPGARRRAARGREPRGRC